MGYELTEITITAPGSSFGIGSSKKCGSVLMRTRFLFLATPSRLNIDRRAFLTCLCSIVPRDPRTSGVSGPRRPQRHLRERIGRGLQGGGSDDFRVSPRARSTAVALVNACSPSTSRSDMDPNRSPMPGPFRPDSANISPLPPLPGGWDESTFPELDVIDTPQLVRPCSRQVLL